MYEMFACILIKIDKIYKAQHTSVIHLYSYNNKSISEVWKKPAERTIYNNNAKEGQVNFRRNSIKYLLTILKRF